MDYAILFHYSLISNRSVSPCETAQIRRPLSASSLPPRWDETEPLAESAPSRGLPTFFYRQNQGKMMENKEFNPGGKRDLELIYAEAN